MHPISSKVDYMYQLTRIENEANWVILTGLLEKPTDNKGLWCNQVAKNSYYCTYEVTRIFFCFVRPIQSANSTVFGTCEETIRVQHFNSLVNLNKRK